MVDIVIASSISLLFTALFYFRFREWRKPRILLPYFAFFFAIDLAVQRYYFPEGVVGLEVAFACLGIAGLFVVGSIAMNRYERSQREAE